MANIHCILNYLCRALCVPGSHSKKLYPRCKKGCGWICKICLGKSFHLSYVYVNSLQTKSYCVLHYSRSYQSIVHYFRGDLLFIYNPPTNVFQQIQLDQLINHDSESISISNKIFAMGDLGVVDEVFEVIIKSKKVIRKAPMLCKKLNHTLCYSTGGIYSIGGVAGLIHLDVCEKYSVLQNKWTLLPT